MRTSGLSLEQETANQVVPLLPAFRLIHRDFLATIGASRVPGVLYLRVLQRMASTTN